MRDKLIELLQGMHNAACDAAIGWLDSETFADQLNVEADYLIAHGVTFTDVPDNNVGDKVPLTIAEKADINRICMSIEQTCRDMAQPGTWEAHTKHMECGEIRELAQRYKDMELVYKALTGHELFVSLGEG